MDKHEWLAEHFEVDQDILGERNPPGIRRLLKTLYHVDHPQVDEIYQPGQRS
ncbi:hypothetical protein [Ktedonobacter racemifer]|uniref:hypothetical protein n=1 Tax=Ktedonobacter racemifer TaxID=363277 RepID=UPI000315B271|nr:hypothetical protein [Ktedonobacter racemifer]